MKKMDRSEHLKWCKQRAIEYIDSGDINNAWASMISDLSKHEETSGHVAIALGAMMIMGGHLSTINEMRRFISDFN